MSVLKVDSVQLEFGDRKILQDVFLSCTQGEVVGLLGRNGCGKSSLLKIIFGALKPSYKHLSIDDVPISEGCLHNVAYLPQHNYLPRGIATHKLATMLVDDKYWGDFANTKIYNDQRYKKAEQLSGGELRQLEMLMILYSKADFILLDEPFTHVTPVQAENFKTIIKTVSQTKGIIVTDHQYYNVLDISNRIILLHNGATKPINGVEDLVTYNYLSGIN
jgi:lipopolysaccharide export system ATP-binding protein